MAQPVPTLSDQLVTRLYYTDDNFLFHATSLAGYPKGVETTVSYCALQIAFRAEAGRFKVSIFLLILLKNFVNNNPTSRKSDINYIPTENT
jgi:hypothetical protein